MLGVESNCLYKTHSCAFLAFARAASPDGQRAPRGEEGRKPVPLITQLLAQP